MTSPEVILEFWFADAVGNIAGLGAHMHRWFNADPVFDRQIEEEFRTAIGQAGRGEFDEWGRTARGRLALIILLDQFPRNVFRGTSDAFAFDERAAELCTEGLEMNADRELSPIERLFFYLPLLHSESGLRQKRSVDCFRRLFVEAGPRSAEMGKWLRLARQHRLVIAMFGRFPHRNITLARRSTPGERVFLYLDHLRRQIRA